MLLTKLHIPTTPRDTVNCQELFNKLDKELSKKLVFVSAFAGYGKAIRISNWIKQNTISAIWCSIAKIDNDPFEFN